MSLQAKPHKCCTLSIDKNGYVFQPPKEVKPHQCCTLSVDNESDYVLQALKERLATVIEASDDLSNGSVDTNWHKHLQLVKSYPEGTIGISFSNSIGEGCSGMTLGGVLRASNGPIIASGSNGILTIATPYFTIHLEMEHEEDDTKTSIDPSKFYKIWIHLVELTFDFTEENFGCHEHNW